MSRIPYPDMEKISDRKKQVVGYPEKDPLNITKIALWAPEGVWEGHVAYKNACIYSTIMDEKLREVLILRTAYLIESDYEIYHHISISSNLGFSDAKREAIRDGRFEELEPIERVVAEFTSEVVESKVLSDKVLNDLHQYFDNAQIMEMLILVINYMGTAVMASVLDLALDGQAVVGWKK